MSKINLKTHFNKFIFSVGAGGLEPPVSERTDLQSVRLPITGYAPLFSECKDTTTFLIYKIFLQFFSKNFVFVVSSCLFSYIIYTNFKKVYQNHHKKLGSFNFILKNPFYISLRHHLTIYFHLFQVRHTDDL